MSLADVLGLLVHGDNHFIVEGPKPTLDEARVLAREWSIIRIGNPPETAGWKIRGTAFREDLRWAIVLASDRPRSPSAAQLLRELAGRGIEIEVIK